MHVLTSLPGLLGIAFASGVNLYAAVLLVGLGLRFHFLTGLPQELQPLAHPAVLILAAILYSLEFVADKIPVVSAAWDAIHTFVRPLGAAALALAATVNLGPVEQVVAGLLGGGVALTSHSAKAGVRLLTHAEPATAAGLSIVEDAFAFSLVALASQYPVAAAIVVAALVIVSAVVIVMVWKALRAMFRNALSWMRNWFHAPAEA